MKGFIYITTNTLSGKKYIGKKYYFDRHNKETNWRLYLGSSLLLKADIKKYGADKFTREIISEHETAEQLAIEETKLIDSLDAVASEYYYNLSNSSNHFFTNKQSIQKGLDTREKWSDERKALVNDKLRTRLSRLTPQQQKERSEKISKAHKNNPVFREMRSRVQKEVCRNQTLEQKQTRYAKLSESAKNYIANMSDEERKKFREIRQRAADNTDNKKRGEAIQQTRRSNQPILSFFNTYTKETIQRKRFEMMEEYNLSAYQLGMIINHNKEHKSWMIIP